MRTPEEWFEIERKASEHLELIGEVARLNGEVARLKHERAIIDKVLRDSNLDATRWFMVEALHGKLGGEGEK